MERKDVIEKWIAHVHEDISAADCLFLEQKTETARMLNKDACQHIIETTKELTRWIEQKLSAETRPSA